MPQQESDDYDQSNQLSYEVNASEKAIYRIRSQTDEERTEFIIETFSNAFQDGIRDNPTAYRGRFRKMSATPFYFYRGSAALFYQDLKLDQDQFIAKNKAAGHVFIHGDLHAENFGTYLGNNGILNFDVNDFDEGYVGPFTWDVKRLLASINLICYSKGFSDTEIQQVLKTCVEEYLKQVYEFCDCPKDQFALTLKNTSGKIKKILNETRIKSHVAHLDSMTYIENYDRKFIRSKNIKDVDDQTRENIMHAFQTYLKTIPQNKKKSKRNFDNDQLQYRVKDIVARSSSGIGSAGKISYSLLIEGRTETLENDIILYMKPAQKSAIADIIKNPTLNEYFKHDGLRIVLCSYAMQASTPRWLGYTTLGSISCLVDAVTAHSESLDWSDINEFQDVVEIIQYVGRAMAKIHCVADSDCLNTPKDIACLPFSIIPRNTEHTIRDTIYGRDDDFIQDMVEFGMVYGEQVRRDHRLFFEAFRNHQIPGL
ncbi:unnamed protein product [Rotaria sp. Silwood1]|nr:unnamed protein product [Rotaria sp. Silwood1]CAF1499620.1 unnamed protein product [Rotaria sp. Silwood1]CAF3666419.1 unnamed protein product [Rotaria sp. Silwood1]CAF3678494.1 unnamed protein product [Rotaria sp. Silwood1]CAF3691693.1 unnamed protein product [Rotaria sp. Silwood1]